MHPHCVAGHGEEDFAAGKKYNLQVLSPVDAHGNFTEEVYDVALVGKFVLTDGNKIVIGIHLLQAI
jgi:isoleucyl-tRNA synthetase